MGEQTGIGWTDHTWNPWRGCWKVSPGCKNCYMYRDQTRYGNNPRIIVRAAPKTFNSPLSWDKSGYVFTCSWSDWFIDQADEWRDEAWDIIRKTPHLRYQILTKRPENIVARLPEDWGNGWDNVWLGVSVESQDYLYRAEHLLNIPAHIRFISYEPALGPVDFSPVIPGIDWIISGGESGPGFRPSNPKWFRSVRDICSSNGVAYFHKQNGGTSQIDGVWGGDLLDGVTYHEYPIKTKAEE